jgi:hypothetical protein
MLMAGDVYSAADAVMFSVAVECVELRPSPSITASFSRYWCMAKLAET